MFVDAQEYKKFNKLFDMNINDVESNPKNQNKMIIKSLKYLTMT